MKRLTPILAACALFLGGCSLSTSQRVGIAGEAYATTTSGMTVLSRTGNLTLEEAENYESYRRPVKAYLDVAIEDLLDGDDDIDSADSALDLLIPLLDRMIELEREAANE